MTSSNRVSSRSPGTVISGLLHKDSTLGPILLSPAFVFLVVMMAYPIVYAVYLSFTDKEIGAVPNFTGLDNYAALLSTSLFTQTVINSLVYTTLALMLKFAGGLILASILNRPFIGQRMAKGLMLLPWILPTVFSTMIWSWIFNPTFSVVNVILVDKLHLLTQPLPFLIDEKWAMASLIFINVWRGVPFFGITFLAAIQSVSTEIIEASRIDGANAWKTFWSIIFPGILPVVIIVSLISTIGTLGDFDLPYLLTNGGPNGATTLFALTAYTLSSQRGKVGLGSAVTMTMFPLLILLVIGSLLLVRRQQQD
jgi:multiple sugar transport system permease protein